MTVINNLILEIHTCSSSLNKYFIQIVCCVCLIFGVDFYLASARKSGRKVDKYNEAVINKITEEKDSLCVCKWSRFFLSTH